MALAKSISRTAIELIHTGVRRLPTAVASALVVLLIYFAQRGVHLPIWYDEMFTLIPAGQDLRPDWQMMMTEFHPPIHAIMVSAWRALPGISETPELARGLNIVFLAPAILGLRYIFHTWGIGIAALVVAMTVSSQHFTFHLYEIRAYSIVFSLSFLLVASMATSPLRPRTYTEIAAASLLGGLHYFGLAMGLTVLGIRAAVLLWDGQHRQAFVYIGAILAILAAYAVWIAIVAPNMFAELNQMNWIKNSFESYKSFFEGAPIPIAFAALAILVSLPRLNKNGGAVLIIAVAVIVLSVTLLISVYRPIVNARYLIVILPSFIIASGALLATYRYKHVVTAVVSILCLVQGVGTIAKVPWRGEDYRWYFEELMVSGCENVPYFAEPAWYTAKGFAPIFGNPIRDRGWLEQVAKSVANDPEIYATCRTIGVVMRVGAPDFKDISKPFEARGIEIETVSNPANHPGDRSYLVLLAE